jgi:hypothetical protein
MFVRFRQTAYRLQVSLVENRRVNGKVRYEHVASLGSVEDPPSVAARLAFWKSLHERLARLSNRVGPDMQATIFGKVHQRIPMVTADEQRALQLENAKADEQFWGSMQGMNEDMALGHKAAVAASEKVIASAQSEATKAAVNAAAAKERVERLERGEDVPGGLGKPMTGKDMERIMRAWGWTTSDLQHALHLAKLGELGMFEEYCEGSSEATEKANDRIEKRIARRMLKERR